MIFRACHVLLFLSVTAAAPAPWAFAGDPEPKQPNFLFIFADDLAFDCVGSSGNDEVRTPHLDELARQGITFTHTYNMGAWTGAVCVSSRTMLNTGTFLWRANGLKKQLRQEWITDKKFWSQRLEQAGYHTYMTGKWHLPVDAKKIFNTVRNIRPGMPNQTESGYHRPKSEEDKNWLPWDKTKEGFWKGGKHWSEIVADDAIDFLSMAADSPQPFFMYIAFNAPHDPRQSPKSYVDAYPVEKISLPKPFVAEYPDEIGCNKIRDEVLAPFPRTPYNVKVNRQEYYAIIQHLDDQIGRILKTLKKSGQADQTYVFFTADHGLAVGHHCLMGKQNMYDHSVRVPFFMTGPGIDPGEKLRTPIYLQDVMPTTLQLAGTSREGVDFKSLLPLIRGEVTSHYESIYGAYTNHQRMITHDGHKLIVYPQIDKMRLFDLASDPWEERDLIDQPDQQARIADLRSRLERLQLEMNDPLPLTEAPK